MMASSCCPCIGQSGLVCHRHTHHSEILYVVIITSCLFHGGKSTGPVTELGRQRCAAAKTIHGFETRAKREYRAKKFQEMRGWSRAVS